ncbi:D-amino-acid transaminase [Salinarimonas ramus]|uniref:Probable branched-chain-amino-acid aminotransferase n=1 Tax=Salinarimonas ramus TaxID=690164 RepID=A0A917Q862_9HYPH|nr:D-amino-acid transaminase [Salinarimonas ramus]GGK34752.1 D-amino-acid transaminase [Salinarimonas ramus]
MSRTVFLNGDFVPFEEARIPVMDRGFLFADGIYEVAAIIDGKLVDEVAHLARLDRSLRAIEIANPYTSEEWIALMRELAARDEVREGLVYIEVTRGVAERDFPFPPEGTPPTVVMFTQAKRILGAPAAEKGVAVITVPDLRWKRRDIKSVALLAQVLAKQEAARAGVSEAWMVEDGHVTEGGSSTAFIITPDDRLVTRPLSNAVLPGITRIAVMQLAREMQLTIEERLFTVEEALCAREAFYTSASAIVMPVVTIDGKAIGDGSPGPMTKRLREVYLALARDGALASG